MFILTDFESQYETAGRSFAAIMKPLSVRSTSAVLEIPGINAFAHDIPGCFGVSGSPLVRLDGERVEVVGICELLQ